MDENIKMDHEISSGWLIEFALLTIISTIFMNIYSTVDGVFVARLVDTNALSAMNEPCYGFILFQKIQSGLE